MPRLSSIAEIRSGATLRGRDAIHPVPNGRLRFLRIGDISSNGQSDLENLVSIDPKESFSDALLLRKGDVLFPNRGTRRTAFAFPEGQPPTLVGSQFFIIRLKNETIMPEYLAWFLRSSGASSHFKARRKKALVQTIEKRDLEEIEIPVPALITQAKIVELDALALRENELSEKIQELRCQLQQGLLLKTVFTKP